MSDTTGPLEKERLVQAWVFDNGLHVMRCARALGMPKSTVQDAIRRLTEKGLLLVPTDAPDPGEEVYEYSAESDTVTLHYTGSDSTLSPRDVMRQHGMDPAEWDVDYLTIAENQKTGLNKFTIKVSPCVVPPRITINHVSVPAVAGIDGLLDQSGYNKTCVVIPDIHVGYSMVNGGLVPYHDRRAVSAAINLCRHIQPDTIVQLGDLMDMPELSRFRQDPAFQHTLQPTIYEASWIMAQLSFCAPTKYFIPGNHDARLERIIADRLPQLHGLRDWRSFETLSVDRLTGLSNQGWQVQHQYPDGRVWLNDNVVLKHGTLYGGKPGTTVRKMLDATAVSTGQGHSHSAELAYELRSQRHGKQIIMCASFGWLGDPNGPIPRANPDVDWHQAVGLIHYGSERFTCNLIPIVDGAAVLGCDTIAGDNYVEELRDMWPDENW